MRTSARTRNAVCISTAATLLAACGGNPIAPGGIPENTAASAEFSHHQTFRYTGAKQTFTVPAGVKSIAISAVGAAAEVDSCYAITGDGGRTDAVIPVTQRERLTVYVGGAGASRGPAGGFNGGGQGGSLGADGTGGGGASDIRTNPGRLKDRILVAGGGGGQGGGSFVSLYRGCGGGGGGLVGGNGQSGAGSPECSDFAGSGGRGGSQTAGGAGGTGGKGSSKCPIRCRHIGQRGDNGRPGTGGNGGALDRAGGGGGGGGGYFGGGGGGSTCAGHASNIALQGGGGGGGSSYAEPSATKVRYWQNWKRATKTGRVIFSW